MKKNKGFTMVELLAVIVILGVLFSVAVVSTSSFLTSSRKKTYEAFEDDMNTATENYLLDHPEDIPLGNSSFTISLEDLIKSGYSEVLEDPENDGVNCTGSVTVTRKEGSNLNLQYDSCLQCKRYQSGSCDEG